jgi:hypothetical protein
MKMRPVSQLKLNKLWICAAGMSALFLSQVPALAQSDKETKLGEEKPTAPSAANATVDRTEFKGVLRRKGSSIPIENASVIEEGNRDNNAQSNKQGTFSLQVPKGNVKVLLRAEGYEELTLVLQDGKGPEEGDILLEPSAQTSSLGVIRARRKTEVSQQSLQREELERIPGTGGDAVRGLQSLPSVLSVGGSADISVRGSAPGDNKYFLDKIELPFVFHLGGLGTVVPTRMLEGVDLYPGGFSSVYNDAIGGVVQLRTENAVPDRTSGKVELSLIQSSVYLEGNIGKTETDDGIGYRTGFRRTYLEVFAPVIKKVGGDRVSFLTLPQATDYQLFFNGKHNSGTWQAYLLGASNRLAVAAESKIADSEDGKSQFSLYNYFQTTGIRYNSNLGDGWGLTIAPQQRYLLIDQRFFGNIVKVKTHLFVLDLSLDKRFNAEWNLGFGIRPEFERVITDVDAVQFPAGGPGPFFDPDTAPRSVEKRVASDVAWRGYLDLGYKPIKNWTINPGVAFLKGPRTNQFEADPRFNTRYGLTEQHFLKGAVGLYSQRPNPAFDSQEYGNPLLRLEKSAHYVAGWETKFGSGWETDLQLYYKDMYNLVGNATENPELKYENNLKGRAKGFEVFLKKMSSGQFKGWISYGYSKSERKDPKSMAWSLSKYDKTHSLNLLASYKITGVWEVGSKFNYASGALTTPIFGGSFNQNTGRYYPKYDDSNGTIENNDSRLPSTYQLDVRTDYDFLFDSWKLGVFAEVLNATNHKNIVGRRYSDDYRQAVDVSGAPIIPNLGVQATF